MKEFESDDMRNQKFCLARHMLAMRYIVVVVPNPISTEPPPYVLDSASSNNSLSLSGILILWKALH